MTRPGQAPAARRTSHPLALRPSLRTAFSAATPRGRPDELLIDWGRAPEGASVSLYWPSRSAIDVVRLASLLHAGSNLEVADAHTVRAPRAGRLSFVPIPFADAALLPGMITLELPATLKREATHGVLVRRFSARPVRVDRKPGSVGPADAWRYAVGSFEISAPVVGAGAALWPAENTLAILKWRLERTPKADPWRAVLERFAAHTAAAVEALGGHPADIPPSLEGAPAPLPAGAERLSGKVCDVLFGPAGAFEGFVLETGQGRRRIDSREDRIGEIALDACAAGLLLTVILAHGSRRILRLIVRR